MAGKALTSRERLQATLNHTEPDRLCVDIGAGGQTGMGAGAVWRLRQSVLGDASPVRITEPYQMLADLGDDLREALGLDVVGIHPRTNLFGFADEGSKPFIMHDGTPVQVPGRFNHTFCEDGAVLMYPEGDTECPPPGLMPAGSYFFDSIERQQTIIEEALNLADNCEEFGLLSEADIDHFVTSVDGGYNETDYGIHITLPGMGFGDIAPVST